MVQLHTLYRERRHDGPLLWLGVETGIRRSLRGMVDRKPAGLDGLTLAFSGRRP
jgi:hypothetical protein